MNLLEIKNLKVSFAKKKLLKGVNLKIEKGKTHFLMGPNGAGKTVLALSLLGHPEYKIKRGSLIFNKKKVNNLSPEKRAKLGLFLAFQSSPEFQGIAFFNFLREALFSLEKKKADFFSFKEKLSNNLNSVGLKQGFLERYLNFGFSGGEKKKSEIVQLLTLKPKLAILDEVDSGLDVDSLKAITRVLKKLKGQGTTLLIITHSDRIAKYLKPDRVHIMLDGRIIKSGKGEIIKKIEKQGYKSFEV